VRPFRIGAGAGFSADRWDPAVELIETCGLDAIVFECLAERTIAQGQLDRLRDPEAGFNPFLEARFRDVLPAARAHGVTIITNMGAANPLAAARRTMQLAMDCGLPPPRIAVVTGDDVLPLVQANPDWRFSEEGDSVRDLGNTIISANAYLGAEAVRDAMATGASIVITGRVADPSLFLGAMMHHHGWAADDWTLMAAGTAAGHLLECAGQVTGGYFCDPGIKEVPDLDRLGFPFAEVAADGRFWLGKPDGSGGCLTPATCTEQILYECGDPARYTTPDCVADFTGVRFETIGPDQVQVSGARALPRTETLKASVCYRAGFASETHVSYAGPQARARAERAADVLRTRLQRRKLYLEAQRIDLIGINALHGDAAMPSEPSEVRVRLAVRAPDREAAVLAAQEAQSLLTNGPAGGGGDLLIVREVIGVRSLLVPRDRVEPKVECLW
jgi:Acyclic terpene utilisation family protein AtuA